MTDSAVELPELFDLDYGDFSDDLLFYENMARRCERPLLELGVGTGRVAAHLAREGFDVWGIDTSEAMLARARHNAGAQTRLHLLPGDMRDFELDQEFDLVFAGQGAFHHLLTPEDQLACLLCVARHLATGGLFVCDLRPWWYPSWEEGSSVPLLHEWTRLLPSTGETVTKLRSIRGDRARQIQHETHIYDRLALDGTLRRTTTTVDLRFTTRYEMEVLLTTAGLELDQIYGDFDLSPFDEASPLFITVARKDSS